jgi:hypothetical protein
MNAPEALGRPALRIAHHHPGRLRVRAAPFFGEHGPATERARIAVEAIPGVHGVEHDGRSASFLVHYDPAAVDVNGVIETIADTADLTLAPPVRNAPLAAELIAAARKLDAVAVEASGGRLGLGAVVSGSLLALGVISFVKGPHARMPRWDSLVYWAYSVFVHVHLSPRRSPS